MKSPIRLCCARARKYGIALVLYSAMNGRDMIVAVIIEWVTVRCCSRGINLCQAILRG